MSYENNKWSDGRNYIIDLLNRSTSQIITPKVLKATKLVLLYFRDDGNHIIFLKLSKYSIDSKKKKRKKKFYQKLRINSLSEQLY
jgi:gluconate kinase